MRRILPSLLASLLVILSFTLSIPQTHAAVLSGWGTSNMDGFVNPSEWANADTISFSYNLGANIGTLYMMNDAVNLYVGLVITDTSLDPNDGIVLTFDNDNGGEVFLEQGDDRLSVRAFNNFADWFYRLSGFTFSLDTGYGGTSDGFSRDSRVAPTNHFELRHPLNSADNAHDFSLLPGQIVGFNFIIYVAGTEYHIPGEDVDNPITWGNDYQVASGRGPISVPSSVVGGFYIPVNSFAVLSPYLALVGVIGIMATILVKRKRSRN